MKAATCPVCRRSVQYIEAVQAKRADDAELFRDEVFLYHHDPAEHRECRGSRKTRIDAENIAFK